MAIPAYTRTAMTNPHTPTPTPARSRAPVPDDPRDLPGSFAHRHVVEVRFADTDAMGHVNNSNYLTYAEIARVAYYERVTGEPLPVRIHGSGAGMGLAEIPIPHPTPALFGETP